MKKNQIQELKSKTVEELRRQLIDSREELGKIKMDQLLGRGKNTNELRAKKKNVARILTFLTLKGFTNKDMNNAVVSESKKITKDSGKEPIVA